MGDGVSVTGRAGAISRAMRLLADHPLGWALPIQAALLFHKLNLLEPWRDEWFTLQTIPLTLRQIASMPSDWSISVWRIMAT